jgi:hypothetical protein
MRMSTQWNRLNLSGEEAADDKDEEAMPQFWEVPAVGALLGTLRATAPAPANSSDGPQSLHQPGGPGGPNGLLGPNLYLKIGEVPTETDSQPRSVYLQCTGEQEDYACTLCIPLGRIETRFAPTGFAALSGDQLSALLAQAQVAQVAQVAQGEIRALVTANLLLRRHGEPVYRGLFSGEGLLRYRADVAPFAPRHKTCREALTVVDAVLQEPTPF